LLAACGDSEGPTLQARDAAIVLLLLDTGLRASKLCRLKLEHVKLDGDPHVLVFGKGSEWREVGPLGKRTVRALRAYDNTWRHPKPGADTFFLNRYGRPMQPITVQRLMERLKERTGVDARTTPHTWRHTWARSRATAGTDVLVISRLMGHTSVQATGLYLGTFGSADARQQVKSLVDRL
jgi:integrase